MQSGVLLTMLQHVNEINRGIVTPTVSGVLSMIPVVPINEY